MWAIPFYCDDCRLRFTVYTRQVRKPYCPKCGDNAATRRNPNKANQHAEKRKYSKWTDDEKKKLIELEPTGMFYREIAELIGKTEKSVNHMVQRMRSEGLLK